MNQAGLYRERFCCIFCKICRLCREGVMKALQCPFLTRIPIGDVRQQACELLQMADLCPIMGHVIKYASAANEVNVIANSLTAGKGSDSTVSRYSFYYSRHILSLCPKMPLSSVVLAQLHDVNSRIALFLLTYFCN